MSRLAPDQPALLVHPLCAAVVEVVAARGYAEASVEEMIERAGVGRQEWDHLFTDKADAVLRVFECHAEDFKRRVGRAFAEAPGWPDNLRAAAWQIVTLIEAYPAAYRFGVWRILEAGEMARLRREELFAWCASLVDAGRTVCPDPAAVPNAAAVIATGAAIDALTRHAAGELDRRPADLVPALMYGAVRPYLGEEAARTELRRAERVARQLVEV
ncbi:MAG: hypothetical protein JSU06_01280 [Actinobacteria bacterium]|nr:hypothetical protein [Actinomycetota bacterium]